MKIEQGFSVEKRECGGCKNFKLDAVANVIGICSKKIMIVTSTLHVSYRIVEGTCFENITIKTKST